MEKIIYKTEIPMQLPSLNTYISKCRGNKYGGASYKRQIENEIMKCLNGIDKIDKPIFIDFIWHEKDRRRDKDNVAFSKKFILDAMQKKGILENDNNHYVIGFSDNFVYKKESKVEIIIKEAEHEE